MNATGYTKKEILNLIKSNEPDALATACEWLESETGDFVENASYSEESILMAVEEEDIHLLKKA